jgi:hypothetical protein
MNLCMERVPYKSTLPRLHPHCSDCMCLDLIVIIAFILLDYFPEVQGPNVDHQGPDFDDMSSLFLYIVNVAFKY